MASSGSDLRAVVGALKSFKDRADVEATGCALFRAVLEAALSGGGAGREDGGGDDPSSTVQVSAEAPVTLLATSLQAACDGADYARAVAMVAACDAALRMSEPDVRDMVVAVKPSIGDDEANALADAAVTVVRQDVGRRAVMMVQRLRQASLPAPVNAALQAMLKQWQKKRMLEADALEGIAKTGAASKQPRAVVAGVDPQAAVAGTTAANAVVLGDDGAVVDDDGSAAKKVSRTEGGFIDAADEPPPPKVTVTAVTAMLSDVLDLLSTLPPAVAGPFWARMPGADGQAFDPLRDPAVLAKLRAILAEAKEAKALNRAAIAGAGKGKQGVAGGATAGNSAVSSMFLAGRSVLQPGAAAAGIVASLTRAPNAPPRLLADIKKCEIPQSRELPKNKRAVKQSPYTFSHLTAKPGSVARRTWGISVDAWGTDSNLAASAPCCVAAPSVPGNPRVVILS